MCKPNHRSTRNKGIEQVCYPVTQDNSEQYCDWTMNPNSVHSINLQELGRRLIPIILNKV